MAIDIQYTPVGGVAELARRGGQQQQAVREQGFQFQQDLIGLQANLQQKRDVMLEGFQQQATLQAQQYETTQQERKYQWLNYQTRKDQKFQEEMVELEIEQYKDKLRFDVKLQNEQYVAKRKFDFDMELQGLATESQFRMQLEQQKIMGDLAEQQMKTQQKERESEAAIKAIQENAYLSPEEQARAITAYQTKQTTMMKPTKNVAISSKAMQLSASMGVEPQLAQDMLAFAETLPNDLVPAYWDAARNPQRQQDFMRAYEQKISEEYGLVPSREQIIKQRMAETGAPRQIAADDQLFKQWKDLGWPRNQAMLGLGAGIKAYALSQVATDKQSDFNKALDVFISASRKLEEAETKGVIGEALTGKKSKVVKALELKRDMALEKMRKIDPILTQTIQSQIEQVTPPPEMTNAEKRAELKRRGWTDKQINDALAGR